MELMIVLLLCTIQLSINPSPAMASTGSPVVHLQSAVTIANHSSILFWFCTPRHRRKRMPLEHCCCITMQWMIEGSWNHIHMYEEKVNDVAPNCRQLIHDMYIKDELTRWCPPPYTPPMPILWGFGVKRGFRRLPGSTTSGMVAANFTVFWRVSGIVHPKIEVETSAKCGRIGRQAPVGLDMAPIRLSSAVCWGVGDVIVLCSNKKDN